MAFSFSTALIELWQTTFSLFLLMFPYAMTWINYTVGSKWEDFILITMSVLWFSLFWFTIFPALNEYVQLHSSILSHYKMDLFFPDEIFLSHKVHLHSFFWKGLEKCRIMLRNLEMVEKIMLNVFLKSLYLYLEVIKLELNLTISLPALLHIFLYLMSLISGCIS